MYDVHILNFFIHYIRNVFTKVYSGKGPKKFSFGYHNVLRNIFTNVMIGFFTQKSAYKHTSENVYQLHGLHYRLTSIFWIFLRSHLRQLM
jgi:hypothetical protein